MMLSLRHPVSVQRGLAVVAFACLPLLSGPAAADPVQVPHLFSNGERADADQVNENFSTLVEESNEQDRRITTLEDGDLTGPGGEQGPQGEPGPPGPQGVQGPRGPAGVVSADIVTRRSCSDTTECACQAGELLLTGGASCSKDQYLYRSRPLDTRTWEAQCEVFADGADATPQSIDLLCAAGG